MSYTHLRAAAAATAALTLGALLAGCGTETVVRTVTTSASATASTATATATATATRSTPVAHTKTADNPTPPAHPRRAALGDALTIDDADGVTLSVTPDQVLDPLPVGSYDEPDPGQRYVGIAVTLRNTGSLPYSDSPSNGATLLSSDGEQATDEIVSGGPCGNGFGSSVKLAPGDVQRGCLSFEMPAGQAPSTFQFTLDSGMADQTGEWSLAGAASASPTPSASQPAAETSAPDPDTTDTTAPAQQSPPASGNGILSSLNDYWSSIAAHRFSAAFADLEPGSTGQSESQWIAGEQRSGVQSASFSGHVTQSDATSATVDVDALTTHDTTYGCRDWTGSYRMVEQNGGWLIARASIAPSACD